MLNNAGNKRNFSVVAITGGKFVPSRRYRIAAPVPYLKREGITVREICPRICTYPPASQLLRPAWLVGALLERLAFIPKAKAYDAVIFQRELIHTLPTLEGLFPEPRILDVDDAIHLNRKALAARHIARSSAAVVCGNQYLADQYLQWNTNIHVIPTGVDTDWLKPRENKKEAGRPVIGWIGTHPNFTYLERIASGLNQTLKKFPEARLQIIADLFPECLGHLGDQLEFINWRPGIELEYLPNFSVGIMPLLDSEWGKGKCAFKILQYMAAGVPVVASPVGVNKNLFASADIGLAPETWEEWTEALTVILENPAHSAAIGRNGRKLVETDYSLQKVAALWSQVLQQAI